MTEQPPRSSNGFTTKFLPGLILGLVVGGLAGAFIPSAMDAVSGPRVPAANGKAPPAVPVKDRDARPTPAPEAAPADAKPPEKKPEEEKAAAPATPPAPAPK
jgi:hypothetical protein